MKRRYNFDADKHRITLRLREKMGCWKWPAQKESVGYFLEDFFGFSNLGPPTFHKGRLRAFVYPLNIIQYVPATMVVLFYI